MERDEIRSAFNAWVVPWWLSALGVIACKARGQPPTVEAVDAVLKESLECALRCTVGEVFESKERKCR